jgi:hypothetical protein
MLLKQAGTVRGLMQNVLAGSLTVCTVKKSILSTSSSYCIGEAKNQELIVLAFMNILLSFQGLFLTV